MSIVIYNPLPPLTEGAFLRAGWTPQVINGVVPDLSGFGKTGTPTTAPCPAFENDPMFGSTLRTYANESGFTFPATLSVTTAGTWCAWYRVPTLTVGGGGFSALFTANVDDGYFYLASNAHAYPSCALVFAGVPRSLQIATDSRIGVWTLYTCTWDGDKIRLYIDGVLGNTSISYGPGTTVQSWNAGTGKIGKLTLATYSLDGNLRAPFILNRCWSDAEVAQYYSLAKTAQFKTDFGSLVSLADEGGTIGQYISNTQIQCGDTVGRWRVETDTINGKQVKCVTCKTVGLLYLKREVMQQEAGAAAFGEWEWWAKLGSTPTWLSVLFSATVVGNGTAAGQNGYVVYADSGPTLALQKSTAGVLSNIIGPLGVGTPSDWHKYTVRRTVAGGFTLLVDDVVQGTVTDVAHLTGNYIVFDLLDPGDKIALGSIDGSNAFVKRLKG